MSIVEICEQIQSAWLSRAISESIWGYPIVGAVHVLAIALFGGAVLIPHLRVLGFPLDLGAELRWPRRLGLAFILITGVLLFASGAAGYYEKTFFKIKMGLLGLLVVNAITASRHGARIHAAIALLLWAAVIFAARGIAFF
jgi:hypothetical protein